MGITPVGYTHDANATFNVKLYCETRNANIYYIPVLQMVYIYSVCIYQRFD